MKKVDTDRIDHRDVLEGSEEYVERQKRDPIYRIAAFLVSHFWFAPSEIADAIGVLLMVCMMNTYLD